ncbi:RING finger domain protein [Aspergillus sclerotialis]|uniref:RING-type E3 ubiquitin transferase n=1 Tax=Aspergillus sclerotialis TaxID=2070753 RepID=A0A3A2Z3P5_9EURO|nr:RING finger domain protein [Aspergillus sclerotialis]
MADNGDRMFCHACGGVWLRDGQGLTCPHCESDFTEIIEIPPDTAPDPSHEDPSIPPHERTRPRPPLNPWADHNPWAHEEPDDFFGGGNGFRHRTYRSPDGRFTFSSTTFGTGFPERPAGPPRGVPGDPLMPMVRSLDTIFHGLADTYRNQGRRDPQQGDPWQNFHGQEDHDREREEAFGPGRRLYPRDANAPQPMAPPFGTLGDILELFRADFGNGAGGGPGGGVRVMTGPNPLAMLSTLLNFDRHGDAVYSQEELDRVISQLIDQNMNGTAPPPASQDAIHSLPKKKVDEEMLGSEGKAECSICMDPVEMGTEVTELPCKHWFHFNCIEMWLNQHNTCPHCRRPISSPQPEGTRENPVPVHDSSESPSSHRRRSNATPFPDYGGHSPWQGQHQSVSPSESDSHERRRSSGNNNSGGFTGWVRSHFGGGS